MFTKTTLHLIGSLSAFLFTFLLGGATHCRISFSPVQLGFFTNYSWAFFSCLLASFSDRYSKTTLSTYLFQRSSYNRFPLRIRLKDHHLHTYLPNYKQFQKNLQREPSTRPLATPQM